VVRELDFSCWGLLQSLFILRFELGLTGFDLLDALGECRLHRNFGNKDIRIVYDSTGIDGK